MRIVDRMLLFYNRFFSEIAEDLDRHYLTHGWQLKATLESAKPFTPTLFWPKEGKIKARAKFIGGLLGHSIAHYEALCAPELWSHYCQTLNAIFDHGEEISGASPDFRFTEDENPFLEELSAFRSALACCLRIAAHQDMDEQIHFFEGYTKALRSQSITAEGKGVKESTRTGAYQLIAIFGPSLKLHMHSVHDVHRFLEKMMGKYRAGSIKRTEAICKSIGMKFRSAGRPPKLLE